MKTKELNKGQVTVITLFYNVEKYFERCLRSLFEQTYENIEYVFVNNCSTDGSLNLLYRILEEYPQRKNSVIVQNNEKNMGYCYSINKGIKLASGEYTTFADSDDWIENKGIESYYEFAKSKEYDIVFFDNYIEYTNGRVVLRKNKITEGSNIDYIKKMLESHMILEGTFWTKIYKTEFLQNSGIKMFHSNVAWGDLCFNVKLFTLSNRIGCLQKAFYHYCKNKEQTTTSASKDKAKKRRWVREEIANLNHTILYLKEKKLDEKCQPELNMRKLMFRNQLIEPWNLRSAMKWYCTYPETNELILKGDCELSGVNKYLLRMLLQKKFVSFTLLNSLKNYLGRIKRKIKRVE